MLSRILVLVLITSSLLSCATGKVYAPVSEVSFIDCIPKKGYHKVIKHDTLYSIAWRYGLDYRFLVEINHIAPPYAIFPGQLIYLQNNKKRIPLKSIKQSKRTHVEKEPTLRVSHWSWPTKGRVIGNFSAMNKGLNIFGKPGQAIHASAPGKVVYSGNGLRAYGNLIIIKHNTEWFSAYAHNQRLLVKERQWVKRGEKIAEMGKTGSVHPMLHFEIRKGGRPVNPLYFLRSGASGL